MFLSSQAKRQNFVKERLGESQKATREAQDFLLFCINIGKLYVSRDLSSNYFCARLLLEELFHLIIKSDICGWKKYCGVSNA